MQSATGQYSTHAGDPAQPVQHSLITARMCGLRLRCVVVPVDFGSYLTTLPSLNSSMLGAPYATKNLPKINYAGMRILADTESIVNLLDRASVIDPRLIVCSSKSKVERFWSLTSSVY